MTQRPSLDDYVDVAERISVFVEKYPEGSLQTINWGVQNVGDKLFIVYQAAAYRTPDDQRPGHGIAWEPFPGPTSFTKDSELMNAETSAWGRAIVAVGLASNRKIASRQEVRNRLEESSSPSPEVRDAAPRIPVDRAQSILAHAMKVGMATLDLDAGPGTPPVFHPVLKAQLALLGVDKIGELNSDTAEQMEAFLRAEEQE